MEKMNFRNRRLYLHYQISISKNVMNVGRKSLFYIGEKIVAILISTYLQFGRNCGQKLTYVLDPEDEEIGILDI